ncbi:hypothetical protein CABS03_07786 [Colletotrichum abscissum]|uniref:Oxidase ustYa n=1 Tax=Colletotrichum abscissum TaxID=1671311 RepID=A0A9Q0B602_9PEZI|nr:hypothetical protein CABS02_05341 [Colletotrichum abscissum]
MIALVVLNRHASPPLHQQTLYGEEPVRSEIRLKNEPRIFDLDEDYAMPPSISVNNAWSSLIPKEGGFFEHPAITSGVSCFAVFHQIHCLDMLRLALYELHPGTKGNRQNSSHATSHQKHSGADSTTDANSSYDIYHVGHCFDLLRQAIMCRPDLTVEILEPEFGGVTGFGTKHQCVNWQELMNWMAINESH